MYIDFANTLVVLPNYSTTMYIATHIKLDRQRENEHILGFKLKSRKFLYIKANPTSRVFKKGTVSDNQKFIYIYI